MGRRQRKKAHRVVSLRSKYGAPGKIRTPDLAVRSRTLYPTELRARNSVLYCNVMAEREGFEPSKRL